MNSPNEIGPPFAKQATLDPATIFLAPHLFLAYLAKVVGRAHRVVVDDGPGQWHGASGGKSLVEVDVAGCFVKARQVE